MTEWESICVQKNSPSTHRWTGCFEGQDLQGERRALLRLRGAKNSFWPPGILFGGLVSRQLLSFCTLARLRSSRAGLDSGGTPRC